MSHGTPAGVPSTCRGAVPARVGLSAASGSDRGRRGRGRPHEERHRLIPRRVVREVCRNSASDIRHLALAGIGSLLMDGLGDTVRVSLTEDPEFELDPCRYDPQTTSQNMRAQIRGPR
eukprot:31698-Eustigmatos_ZCMA.PRE.1